MIKIKNIYDEVIYTSALPTIRDALIEAVGKKINLRAANLQDADLRAANLRAADLQGADLQGANLQGANLRGADLQGADLRGVDLRAANLRGANLQGANLRAADLQGAYLQGAYLQGADLQGADLQGANLQGANLQGANLRAADLQGADLRAVDLRGANLRGANLQGANLRAANLQGADLQGAKNAELALARIQFIPPEGAFRGWKKCQDGRIVMLGIPVSAKRSHGAERKCRCSKAKVLLILAADGNEVNEAVSVHDSTFIYRKGKIVESKNGFDEDRWNTCGAGIHFYLTKEEAQAHD